MVRPLTRPTSPKVPEKSIQGPALTGCVVGSTAPPELINWRSSGSRTREQKPSYPLAFSAPPMRIPFSRATKRMSKSILRISRDARCTLIVAVSLTSGLRTPWSSVYRGEVQNTLASRAGESVAIIFTSCTSQAKSLRLQASPILFSPIHTWCQAQ